MDSRFDTVESVLEDVRAGRLVIVTDDEKRENEGDLVCAAEKITPEPEEIPPEATPAP